MLTRQQMYRLKRLEKSYDDRHRISTSSNQKFELLLEHRQRIYAINSAEQALYTTYGIERAQHPQFAYCSKQFVLTRNC